MNDSTDATGATDAVCCLYLARVAEREGHPEAAGRWLKKADRWLEMADPQEPPKGAIVNSQGCQPLDQERSNQHQALEGRK